METRFRCIEISMASRNLVRRALLPSRPPCLAGCSVAHARQHGLASARVDVGKSRVCKPGLLLGSARKNSGCAAMASVASAGVVAPTHVETVLKKVLVPVGKGTEEMEAVIIIDILRRAGADVTVASVEEELQILASRNVKLEADTLIGACQGQTYDLVVLPGGMPGSERLRDSEVLRQITEAQAQHNRLYGAICAAPAVALQSWGLLKGVQATCHPAFAEKLSNNKQVDFRVLKDGLVTTSRGPGTAIEFALSLVEQLFDQKKVEELALNLVLNTPTASRQEYNAHPWWTDADATPRALVPIASGSEEMEVVIVVDVLRRAQVEVVVASVERDLKILASRKVKIIADKLIEDVVSTKFDLVILPGGMPGATKLSESAALQKILAEQKEENRIYGAICAAPAVVLEANQLLKGKRATAHPAFSGDLLDQSAVDSRVVIDGKVITSRGPGTAMEFALTIVEKLFGHDKAQALAAPMVFHYE